jgi:hypothetical protein
MVGMAAQKSSSPAMEFLISALKANPKAAYGDLKAKADEKGLKLYPIMFGRAQLTLGIAKAGKGKTKARAAKAAKAAPRAAAVAGRGRKPDANSKSGKIRVLLGSGMSAGEIAKKLGCTPALVYNVKARMAGGGPAKRASGRPRATSGGANLNGIAGILDAVKNSERERAQMRAALEKIQALLADALA